MERVAANAEDVGKEHRRLQADISRLGKISTELEELGDAYSLSQWAERASQGPDALLPGFVDLLKSFEGALKEHFAREDQVLPEVARKYNAADVVTSFMNEHKEVRRKMAALRRKAVKISQSDTAAAEQKEQLKQLAKELRPVLNMIRGHAEKEDELLFIVDHNV